MKIDIPSDEIEITFVRSSGPGGQNVNKKNSKAQIRWNMEQSKVLTPEQKDKLRQKLRISVEGYMVVTAQTERSQAQNEARAMQKLHDLVEAALHEDEERIETRPTRGSQERRLATKQLHSRRKQQRRWPAE